MPKRTYRFSYGWPKLIRPSEGGTEIVYPRETLEFEAKDDYDATERVRVIMECSGADFGSRGILKFKAYDLEYYPAPIKINHGY